MRVRQVDAGKPTTGRNALAENGPSSPGAGASQQQRRPCTDGRLLSVGFAALTLKLPETFGDAEIAISELEEEHTEEGTLAVLSILDQLLDWPELSTGFVFVQDLRELVLLDFDLVQQISAWASQPHRRDKWSKACLEWKILVCDSPAYVAASVLVLSLWFAKQPPLCVTYLLASVEAASKNSCVMRYDPGGSNGGKNTWYGLGLWSLTDDIQPDTFVAPFVAVNDLWECPSKGADPVAHTVAGPGAESAYVAKEEEKEPALSLFFDAGFIHCVGEVGRDGKGSLKLLSRGGEQTKEALDRVLEFMDAFSKHKASEQGFSVTYDLRFLSMPSMNLVMHLAEWGNEPVRQERWQRLNYACKVVVRSGFALSVAKGLLGAYFLACPPVCRTYLLTDPDEPEEDATYYEPSPNVPVAAGGGGRGKLK